MIGCLFIPAFPVMVERGSRPELADAPLIIAHYRNERGRVYAFSSDLNGTGIKQGMPIRQARLLCPEAQAIPAAINRYQHALEDILTILRDYANKIEPVQITPRQAFGIIYLDLGRMRKADAEYFGSRMVEHLQERTGFEVYLGMAKSKFTALVAASYHPEDRLCIITPDQEAGFLASKPVSLLPVGKEMKRRLSLLGIRTIGQFAALPSPAVFNQFGQYGQRIHRMAQGRDGRPVRPQKPARRECAQWQFDPPVDNRLTLDPVLKRLSHDLSQRLTADGLGAEAVTLSLLLDDHRAIEDMMTLNQPTSGQERLYWTLCYLLQRVQIPCAVAQLEIHLSELAAPVPRQLSLFDNGEAAKSIDDVLIDLIPRYGVEPFYDIHPAQIDAAQIERRFWLEPVAPESVVIA